MCTVAAYLCGGLLLKRSAHSSQDGEKSKRLEGSLNDYKNTGGNLKKEEYNDKPCVIGRNEQKLKNVQERRG